MEARKITIIETKNQKKSVIMSEATTLSELKKDLRDNGIDYTGMTFFEGTSKTELKDDASVLPHDVPYKGTITNELVFMLTNTNKKIRSGAAPIDRMEVYRSIKELGLQEACMKKFGKNFTMCKTADLIALIQTAPVTEIKTKKNDDRCADTVARAAINKLVEILESNRTIKIQERKKVSDLLEGGVVAAPYSDDEIDNMFNFID